MLPRVPLNDRTAIGGTNERYAISAIMEASQPSQQTACAPQATCPVHGAAHVAGRGPDRRQELSGNLSERTEFVKLNTNDRTEAAQDHGDPAPPSGRIAGTDDLLSALMTPRN